MKKQETNKNVKKELKKPSSKNSSKDLIKFKLNGLDVSGNSNDTIIDVAKRNGIEIPNLCMDERLERKGACRLCVVEIEGIPRLFASCSTKIREGINVLTNTKKVLDARKTNLELLLANHNRTCLTCSASTHCRLQKYSNDFGIKEVPYHGSKRKSEIDNSSVSLVRDNSKCILCGRCVNVCNELQTVFAIGLVNRGFNTFVGSALNTSLEESSCVNCGQCIQACPTGALTVKNNISDVLDVLKDPSKIVVVQTAPSVRVALGECFGIPAGTSVTKKLVSALRRVGFDKVFDTDLGADLTIVEEATEFIHRFTSGKNLPLITSCCPGWVKFAEQFYFDQLNHLSTCKSPQGMMGSVIKNYYAKKNNVKRKDIVAVTIMPCTAKKYEAKRPELENDIDHVLTTVELADLIKQFGLDLKNLPDEDYDDPLGESTGAGVIFGRSGGVMEAALRTAADVLTKKDLKQIDYHKIRGLQTMKTADLNLAGVDIKVCVVHTLGEARKIMEQIRAGTCPYHFIEVMACYGGCIGGGGQPRVGYDLDLIEKRAQAIKNEDTSKKIRKSHQNDSVNLLYKNFFGEYGSKKAHKYLHTKYDPKEFI